MLKRFQVTGYFLAFFALCGFFGWNVIVASKPPLDVAEYQKRLNITAANISAPRGANTPDDSLRIYAVNVVIAATRMANMYVSSFSQSGNNPVLFTKLWAMNPPIQWLRGLELIQTYRSNGDI